MANGPGDGYLRRRDREVSLADWRGASSSVVKPANDGGACSFLSSSATRSLCCYFSSVGHPLSGGRRQA
jgi:hypothetical protein